MFRRQCFQNFRTAIDELGCSVMSSMHMVAQHTESFCDKNGCGLLVFSEESAESLHSEVSRFFVRWKVPKSGKPKDGDFMLRMFSALNSVHFLSL